MLGHSAEPVAAVCVYFQQICTLQGQNPQGCFECLQRALAFWQHLIVSRCGLCVPRPAHAFLHPSHWFTALRLLVESALLFVDCAWGKPQMWMLFLHPTIIHFKQAFLRFCGPPVMCLAGPTHSIRAMLRLHAVRQPFCGPPPLDGSCCCRRAPPN